MSYLLDFKKWYSLHESLQDMSSESGIHEQIAVTAIALHKHPDCIAMGKAVASAGKDKLPYDQLVEYAGQQLYCRLEKKSESIEAGSTSFNSAQLTFNVYCIGTSKYSMPVPKYLGMCFVDRLGKLFPVNAPTVIGDNSMSVSTDTTSSGFKNFPSEDWDKYATSTFVQYVNNIIANKPYLNKVFALIKGNPTVYKSSTKPAIGMASVMQKIVDAVFTPV